MRKVNIGEDKTQLVSNLKNSHAHFSSGANLDLTGIGAQDANGGSHDFQHKKKPFFNLKVDELPDAKAHSTKWSRIPETLGLGNLKLNFSNFGTKLKFIRRDEAPSRTGRTIHGLGRLLKIVVISTLALICAILIFRRFFMEDDAGISPNMGEFYSEDNPLGAASDSQPSWTAQLGLDGLFHEALSFLGLAEETDPFADMPPAPINKLQSGVKSPGKKASSSTVQKHTAKKDKLVDGRKATANDVSLGDMFPNPYWYLPNSSDSLNKAVSRSLNPLEAEELRKALQHPFFYQRHKLINGIISNRLGNSEAILREAAINSPRLWLRMNAVIGLAHLGYPVSLEDVEKALGDDPTYRVANYFKRFSQRGGAAEKYVMHYAIKIVGDKARRAILQALRRNHSQQDLLYLAAGAFDPGSKTSQWLRASGSLNIIPKNDREKLRKEVVRLGSQHNIGKSGTNPGSKEEKALIEESLELID